jgi:hypothetical protein
MRERELGLMNPVLPRHGNDTIPLERSPDEIRQRNESEIEPEVRAVELYRTAGLIGKGN